MHEGDTAKNRATGLHPRPAPVFCQGCYWNETFCIASGLVARRAGREGVHPSAAPQSAGQAELLRAEDKRRKAAAPVLGWRLSEADSLDPSDISHVARLRDKLADQA
jgi:hypothetical protein